MCTLCRSLHFQYFYLGQPIRRCPVVASASHVPPQARASEIPFACFSSPPYHSADEALRVHLNSTMRRVSVNAPAVNRYT